MPDLRVGEMVALLEISRAWLVDPVAGREGPGEIVVRDGILEAVTWLEGAEAEGIGPDGVVVLPGFLDLHVHLREPGNEDAETVASGLAAAAHGGFTTVCAMPNTTPAADEPGVLARVAGAAAASGSPVELLTHGAVTVGRAGERLAALGELADAGVVGFSDDGSPVKSAILLRNALLYAGMLGLPLVEHAEDPSLTAGAEANEGLVATILGLKGWPAAAEVAAAERAIAILDAVRADAPGARLHLTHLSTAGALDAVRRAKAAGLPVTCDVTPHHLGFTDEWVAGARRWAWEALDAGGAARDPWADGALVAHPYSTACRVNPPLRGRSRCGGLPGRARGRDGRRGRDRPRAAHGRRQGDGVRACRQRDQRRRDGLRRAARCRRGREAAAGAGGGGPDRRARRASWVSGPVAAAPGAGSWRARRRTSSSSTPVTAGRVTADALASRGKNTPLLGRELPGRIVLTVAQGRLAYADPARGE